MSGRFACTMTYLFGLLSCVKVAQLPWPGVNCPSRASIVEPEIGEGPLDDFSDGGSAMWKDVSKRSNKKREAPYQ